MSDNSIRLELVENLQPLRALARRLTRDVESAEDAVQDTVVAALGAAGPTGSVRGWLRTILRNAIRAAARSARRREQRELAVRPGTESAHATPEVALELQAQRRLLQLVQELDDPLRQVLFLRFWRDLAPRVIAERLGVPVKSVQVAWQRPERQPDPWHGSPMAAGSSSHVFGDGGVTTDRDGRFAFAGLVVDGAMLSFRGEALLLPAPLALAAVDDLEQLDVVLPVRSSFRIVLDRPDEADAVKITNAVAGQVTVLVRVEGFEMSMREISINAGQSPEASAQAGEVVVVLLRRGVEVRRVVVRLPPGGVHDLRI